MSNETVTPTIELMALLEAAGFVRNIVEPKTKQGGRFKPVVGKKYWIIYSEGRIDYSLWDDDLNSCRYAMGNCYRTEAEAIAARDKQLALVRVQDKLEELTDELLDWSDAVQSKYVIYYNHATGFYRIAEHFHSEELCGLYGSESACNWVIDNMEPDLKLIAGIL